MMAVNPQGMRDLPVGYPPVGCLDSTLFRHYSVIALISSV